MHFCFIDESGTGEPNPKNPRDVLVLAGVIVPEAMFVEFSQQVDAMKSSFGLSPNDEIHSCRLDNEVKGQGIEGLGQMTRADRRKAVEQMWESKLAQVDPHNHSKVLNRQGRDRAYIHLSGEERARLLEWSCDLLAEVRATVLISAVDQKWAGIETALYPALIDMNLGFQKLRGNEPGVFIHDECSYKQFADNVVTAYQKMLNSRPGSDKTISTLPFFC